MQDDTPAQQAIKANQATYNDGGAVAAYTQEAYHILRQQLVLSLVEKYCKQRDSSAGPIVEIGGAEQSILRSLSLDRKVFITNVTTNTPHTEYGSSVEYLPLDATKTFPLQDQSVACIVMGELVEHLYEPDATLRECWRVLKPQGALVITTPNLLGIQDRLRAVFGKAPRQIDALHPYLRLHIRPFTASSLQKFLESTGFKILELQSNFVGWELPSGRWLQSRQLAQLFPSLGGSLVVLAQKTIEKYDSK